MSRLKTNTMAETLDRLRKTAAGEENPPTSHPTSGPQEGATELTTGSREDEHERLRKELEGPSPAESTASPTGEGELVATTNPKPVGEDPDREFKDRPDDVETSHPANASVGPKYSRWQAKLAQFEKHGQELLNAIAGDLASAPAAPASPAAGNTQKTAADPTAGFNAEQLQAYELAKQAALQDIMDVQRVGVQHASLWYEYLKQAAEEEAAGESGESAGDEAAPKKKPASESSEASDESEGGEDEGEGEYEDDGGDMGGGEMPEEELMQLMQLLQQGGGGGDMLGGGGGGEMAGMDPLAGGMPPGMEGGGMPPGAEGGMPGGDAGAPIDPAELEMLAQESGMAPEELMALLGPKMGARKQASSAKRPTKVSPQLYAMYKSALRDFVKENLRRSNRGT